MMVPIVQKDHPTIYERDMHHCPCCTPPRRTLVREVREGLGVGYPEFYCAQTGLSYRFVLARGAGTYIGGRRQGISRDGRIVSGV